MSQRYQIRLKPKAEKDLREIPARERDGVVRRLRLLEDLEDLNILRAEKLESAEAPARTLDEVLRELVD